MICRSCLSRWGYFFGGDPETAVPERHGAGCAKPDGIAYVAPEEALRRWPRLTAHMICESLGYATPTTAASIVAAVKMGIGHHCEWISACHAGDPRPAVRNAVRSRHHHRGFMADFGLALALVRRAASTGSEPALASWF